MTTNARPLGGRVITPLFLALLGLAAVAGTLVIYRLFAGVGSITALTDA